MRIVRKFFKEWWTTTKNSGDVLGYVFLILGLLALITQFILILIGSNPSGELIGVMLGLFSVGLGLIAINMAAKSDKKYTELLNRMDMNIINLLEYYDREHDKIERPIGNIILKPQPATLELKTVPPEVKIQKSEKTSKEETQKRLDKDTKRVGYVRGEIYQLEDGSWGIHWGGKYPL
jgi:hypothetical protein